MFILQLPGLEFLSAEVHSSYSGHLMTDSYIKKKRHIIQFS